MLSKFPEVKCAFFKSLHLFNHLRLHSTALFCFSNRKSLPFRIFSKFRKSADHFLIAAFPNFRSVVAPSSNYFVKVAFRTFIKKNCKFTPHDSNQETKPSVPLDQLFLKIHEQASKDCCATAITINCKMVRRDLV